MHACMCNTVRLQPAKVMAMITGLPMQYGILIFLTECPDDIFEVFLKEIEDA